MALNVSGVAQTDTTATKMNSKAKVGVSTLSDIELVQQLYGQTRQKTTFLISTQNPEEERRNLNTKIEQKETLIKDIDASTTPDKKKRAKLQYKLQNYRRSLEFLNFVKGQGTVVWIREPKVYVLVEDKGMFALGFNRDLQKIAIRNGPNGETQVGSSFSELRVPYPVTLFHRAYSAADQEISGFFQMIKHSGSGTFSTNTGSVSDDAVPLELKQKFDSGDLESPPKKLSNIWSNTWLPMLQKGRTIKDSAELDGTLTSFQALLSPYFDLNIGGIVLDTITSTYSDLYKQLSEGGTTAITASNSIMAMIDGVNVLEANLKALDSAIDAITVAGVVKKEPIAEPGAYTFETGASGTDSGAYTFETGASGTDSGASGNDSGASGNDSGASGNDSGASGNDSGASGKDSGAYTFETGASGTDSGAYTFETGASGTVPDFATPETSTTDFATESA